MKLKNKIISALAILLILPVIVSANADLNNDGNVDVSDLIIVAGDFGKTSGFNSRADTDSNNIVDIFDVVYVASRFGTTSSELRGLAYYSLDASRENAWSTDPIANKLIINGAQWTEGVSGNALEFDGVDDYVEAYHDDSLNISGHLSVACWVKIFDDGTHNPIVVKSFGQQGGFFLVVNSYDNLYLRTSNNGIFSDVKANYNGYYNEWHYVAGVFNGSHEILYIDGVEKKKEVPAFNTVPPSNNMLMIGKSEGSWGGGDLLKGFVDEIKIFDRALTQQEIQQLMNEKPKPPEAPPPPIGNIIYAESLNLADIQNAVNLAEPGNTVVLPAGTVNDFIGTITVSKGITIQGQGKTTTVLKRGRPTEDEIFHIDPFASGNEKFYFHDIGLWGYGSIDSASWDRGIRFDYSGLTEYQIIIYNCDFRKFGYAGIDTWGYWHGVIYNCDFIDNSRAGLGYGVAVNFQTSPKDKGNNSWNREWELGSYFNIFVEDCYSKNNRHFVTAGRGGRHVVRYNTLNGTVYNARGIDAAHGYNYKTGERSTRSFEIYHNTIRADEITGGGIGSNGGDGVIWNNTITNATGTSYILFQHNSAGQGLDYPLQDQQREIYVWDNIKEGNPWSVTVKPEWCQEYIQEGRDYFLYKKSGYTHYTYPHPLRGGVS